MSTMSTKPSRTPEGNRPTREGRNLPRAALVQGADGHLRRNKFAMQEIHEGDEEQREIA